MIDRKRTLAPGGIGLNAGAFVVNAVFAVASTPAVTAPLAVVEVVMKPLLDDAGKGLQVGFAWRGTACERLRTICKAMFWLKANCIAGA